MGQAGAPGGYPPTLAKVPPRLPCCATNEAKAGAKPALVLSRSGRAVPRAGCALMPWDTNTEPPGSLETRDAQRAVPRAIVVKA